MNARTKRGSTLLRGAVFLLVAGFSLFVGRMALASDAPTIQSDLPDYMPGMTVTLTGAGWDTDGAVHVVVNDDAGESWRREVDVPPTPDGTIEDVFSLPTWFVAAYSVTATQQRSDGGLLQATWRFTDASADLDQCANDPAPSPSSDGCSAAAADWVNGNLGESKSSYLEGDSIPYRLKMDGLTLASHVVIIDWDTTQGGKHATDYLTTYDRTVTTADPCLGVTGCPLLPTTFPIPLDPQVSGAGVSQLPGVFTLYGGTITSVSSYTEGATFPTGNNTRRIAITFTASQSNPVLAWAGHISTRTDWGLLNSAINIPGSPYHMRLIDLDGKGGNQDRSLSAQAVVFPASITIVKQATPEGATSFPFTGTPTPLNNFNLVDGGTSGNTKTFAGMTDFKTYTILETPPAGWTLTGIVCSVSSANGGSQVISSPSVSIALKEGENVTCTYSNLQQTAQLKLVKTVTNDNGGGAATIDFTLSAAGPTPKSGAGGFDAQVEHRHIHALRNQCGRLHGGSVVLRRWDIHFPPTKSR